MNTNNPSKLKLSSRQKFVDGWTDRRAEGQTDRKMNRAIISIGCTLPKQGSYEVVIFYFWNGDLHLSV